MSLPSSSSKAVFQGNGLSTEFPFSFRVWEPSEISVSVTDPDGVTSTATGYVVVLAESGDGGTVAYTHGAGPLPAGWRLTILRNMPFTQSVDLLSGTRFDPQVIEDQMDRSTAERQQLKEAVDRAVKLPAASDLTPEEYGRELLDAKDDAQEAAQQAAQSAQRAEHALAETVEVKSTAIREIREETEVQADRLQAVADVNIVTMNREADRAHDEADRAEREANRAASTATVSIGSHNLESTWIVEQDIPAGSILSLPNDLVYFPGRNMLRLSFEGVAYYPGAQFEEVGAAGASSTQIRMLCDVPAGVTGNAWIVASNVAKQVQQAEAAAEQARDEAEASAKQAQAVADALENRVEQAVDAASRRAEAAADTACGCAGEAETAKNAAVTAARDAQEFADLADDAATDAENAAARADAATRRQGIASVLRVSLLGTAPNGFYILNPHVVVPGTDSFPLIPLNNFEEMPTLEGFYLIGGIPEPKPDDPDKPKPDDPDCPDW